MRAAGRRIIRDSSSVLFVAQLVVAGTAFAANILSARALGPSGRGELALLLQIAYFGTLAVLLGCDRAVVTVYQGSPVRTVTRNFVRLLLRPSAVTLAIAAVIIALPLPFLESWRLRLSFAAAFMVVNAFSRAVRSIAIAAGRAGQFLAYEVTGNALLLGGLTLLVAVGRQDSGAWVLAYLVTGFLTTASWLLWWSRTGTSDGAATELGSGTPVDAPDEDHRRRLARREGLHLLPATVAHSGTLRLDRLILAGMVSTAALGLYAAVATIVELIAWPLMVFADSRLGVWRQAHDRGELSLRSVFALAVPYCVVAVTLMSALLHVLLVPLLGADFNAALPLVVPLAVAAAVFGLSQLLITALTAVRRGRLASLVEVIGLAVSVLAYVILIGRLGSLGAAYGSLVGYSSGLLLAWLLLVRTARGRVTP